MSDPSQIIMYLNKILSNLESLKKDMSTMYMSKEAFEVYWGVVNKDLNNLGSIIRELIKKDASQDLKQVEVSVKVKLIIAIAGLITGAVIGGVISFLMK